MPQNEYLHRDHLLVPPSYRLAPWWATDLLGMDLQFRRRENCGRTAGLLLEIPDVRFRYGGVALPLSHTDGVRGVVLDVPVRSRGQALIEPVYVPLNHRTSFAAWKDNVAIIALPDKLLQGLGRGAKVNCYALELNLAPSCREFHELFGTKANAVVDLDRPVAADGFLRHFGHPEPSQASGKLCAWSPS